VGAVFPFDLALLYRGPLASCSFRCGYCPFHGADSETGRPTEPAPETRPLGDREALERFCGWLAELPADKRVGLLFTPRGEALEQSHYRQALVDLSRRPQLAKVAIQTNLSAPLSWLSACEPQKIGIWATFHRRKAGRSRFLSRVRRLHDAGVSVSVGVVGLREELDQIEDLRAELPREVYLWVNAFKRREAYYDDGDIARLTRIDPLFAYSQRPHPSQGRPCLTGERVLAVDGDGEVRRCHFSESPPLGNIYDPSFALERALHPRPCDATSCRCHIGYVHMPELGLVERFGDGLLERALSRPNAPC
jgi:hypothetical protein